MAPNHTGFVPPIAGKLPTRTPVSARTTLSSAPSVLPARPPLSSAPALITQPLPQLTDSNFGRDPAGPAAAGTSVVLFRSDLRLDDHPALARALEESSTVLPVFCFDPRHFGRTEHGFDKTGKYRARFLIDSVTDLRTRLQEKGSDLIVRIGKPEDVVPQLARSVSARQVFLHREVTFEEQQVEEALEKTLSGAGIEMHSLWSNTLYHEDDLPFALNEMPDVYSDFREAVEKKSKIREPVAAPEDMPNVPPAIEAGNIPTLSTLGISDLSVNAAHAGVSAVRGGEREALTRVRAYVDDTRRADGCNGSHAKACAHIGADFSCRISPWLALGCVSPRRIFHEMTKASMAKEVLLRSSTYFELVWRDFFRCITAKYSGKRSAAMTRGSTVRGRRAVAA